MRKWEALKEITKILVELSTERAKIERITEILRQYLAVARCVILEIKEGNKQYQIITATPHSSEEHGIGSAATLSGKEAIEQVVKTQKTLLISDAKTNPLTSYMHDWALSKDINAILFVPLIINHEVEAIMVYDATGGKKFSDDEIEFTINYADAIEELLKKEKERRYREQQLQYQEELDFAFRICGDLEHVVRAPFLVIGGFVRRTAAQVTELGKFLPEQEEISLLTEKIKENFDTIKKEIKEFEKVFTNFIGLAKIGRQLRLADVNINIVLFEVLRELKKENPTFCCKASFAHLPRLFRVDQEKISLAIRHILAYAFEEADKQPTPDQQKIWVNSHQKNNKAAEITIAHCGELRKEAIEHLLYPLRASNKTMGNGVVGLSIAQKLIALNGGELTIITHTQEKKVIYRITFPLS